MKKNVLYFIITGFVLAAVMVAGCSKNAPDTKETQEVKQEAKTEETALQPDELGLVPADKTIDAPAWTMADLEGDSLKLADYKGKVVILDFWDTWCPPCKKEIPGFIELQDKYGDDGLVIVGAAFGKHGKDKVKEFVDEYKINYPTVFATPLVAYQYGGIQSIPTTFVIDRDGKLRGMHVGYVKKEIFEKQVIALL